MKNFLEVLTGSLIGTAIGVYIGSKIVGYLERRRFLKKVDAVLKERK